MNPTPCSTPSGRLPLAAVALAALALSVPAAWAQSTATGTSGSSRVAPNPKDPAASSYNSGGSGDSSVVTPYGAHPSGSLSGSQTGAAGRSAYGTSSNVPAGTSPDSMSNSMNGTTSGVSTTGMGTGNAVPPSTGAAGTTGAASDGSTSGAASGNSSSLSSTSSQSGSGLSTPAAAGADTTGSSSYDPATSGSGSSGSSGGMSSSMGSGSSSDMALPSEPTGAGPSGSSRFDSRRQSWIPYTSNGYVSIAYGGADFGDLRCATGFNCDNPDWAVKINTGGMLNEWVGIELGYIHTGNADFNGGDARVRGVNLSLTGFLPLNYGFSLMGKVGGTYGWTKLSGTAAGTPRGSEEGFGVAYGAGLSFDFNPNWSLTLEWERHRMKFAGDDTRDVDLATLGVRYRF